MTKPNNKTKASKLYVGKIFTLKNIWRIPWASHNSLPWYAKRAHDRERFRKEKWCKLEGKDNVPYDNGSMAREEIGERILILDETTKRAKIMTHRGKAIWISKFYLGTEIKEEIEGNPSGELSKVITELCNIKNSVLDKKISDKLQKVIRQIRVVTENLENTKS